MEHWLWILLAALFFVTLNCTFETSDSSPYLFWYKQSVNSYPKYILKLVSKKVYNAEDFPKDRFDAELKDKSFHLEISSAAVSDSAVYYCALEPTVTGNSSTRDSLSLQTQSLLTNKKSVEEKDNLSHSHVAIRQIILMLIFSGTDIIQTFRLLSLYSGKEQNHGVAHNIFLMVDMDPKQQTHQLH
uniref:Ig-like domain-containing protein n=1 Tax=Salarias fasciatus TaxID=181472 RepID=A0A672H6M5_SALFA